MTCLAILVPTTDGLYADSWRPAFDRYAAALSTQGFSVEALDWRLAAGTDADVVTPLLAWGYHLRKAEWLAGLKSLAAEGLPVINSAALLRWNTTKTYLNDLEDAEVPVVPTIFADRLTPTVCRIDLIRHLDGSLRLMEREVIEPDLFLEHAPDAAASFAAAMRRALDEVG